MKDSKKLFDDISKNISKIITNMYSTSFSFAIRLLNKRLHDPIYAIYGFVRLGDEIVDSFHNYNKKKLMQEFRDSTKNAIADHISINPILHNFQEIVHKYDIEWEIINDFLESMEYDLEEKTYDNKKYKKYIKGSAEAVGLMCLKVFCYKKDDLYQDLEEFARCLGSAFQKINFLRDIGNDYYNLQRTYFPEIDIEKFNEEKKKDIERDIEKEFKKALYGINSLPQSSKKGVYLAYIYYVELLKKIKTIGAKEILEKRIRISNTKKIILLFRSYVKY